MSDTVLVALISSTGRTMLTAITALRLNYRFASFASRMDSLERRMAVVEANLREPPARKGSN